MANTHIFTGADGAISVAAESGVAGDLASEIADTYSMTPIGRAVGVTAQVESQMRPFHEIGQRYATELRPGNVNVTGSVGRAHINGALLKLMLGEGAEASRPGGAFVSPAFNLSLRLENPGYPGNTSTVTLHGVRFDGWSLNFPEDDFVMEEVSFKALWVSAEDAEA